MMIMTLDNLITRAQGLRETLPGDTKCFLPGYNDSGIVGLYVVGTTYVRKTDVEEDGEVVREYEQGKGAEEVAILFMRKSDDGAG